MSSRFALSFLGAFLATLFLLGAAGYAITRFSVREPREPYRAGSFEFDLEPGWQCEMDGTEIVCKPPGKAPRGAIAIIALKERSGDDNLELYEAHLRKPQRPNANQKLSRIRYVKRRLLGTKEWVESVHEGSELPNYITYYLATTTSLIGILVTMSVHKDHEAEYVRQLDNMMSTLNVYQR